MTKDGTERTRSRYDRIARVYGAMEWMEGRTAFRDWRARVWERVEGSRVLEVGVGTGTSIPFHPPGVEVTAIDFSPQMLARARRAAEKQGSPVRIMEMDVQSLDFSDGYFDEVVTTCVFCSVPDPVVGFREIKRVLRPGGRAYLLEHVLSGRPGIKQVMDAANPLVKRMMGANINRRTRDNLEAAGLEVVQEEDLWMDIVKLFVARAPE